MSALPEDKREAPVYETEATPNPQPSATTGSLKDSPPNVLEDWPDTRWRDYLAGYESGYSLGIDRGRQIEHDDVAAIQRHAAGIVHAMAKLAPRDLDEDRARRARIDQRFGGDAA